MAVIATKEDSKPVVEYPKLMQGSEGTIVLMTERGRGAVVAAGKYLPVGHYSVDWNISSFTDFNGTVTLKNGFAE